VVGNSWGCPDFEGCSKHAMTSAVEILRAAGVFMSVSAGNEGPECETVTAPPSFEPSVITVGAVDIGDFLAPFSSRGPVKIDGLVYRKPDVVAPGVGVMGAHLNGSYRRLSGTSMASPHIGGSVALMSKNHVIYLC
jgi:serine protease AprX